MKYAPRTAALASGALLRDGDFLISRANTPSLVGLCGVYRDEGTPTIYSDLMMRLDINPLLDKQFLEIYLLDPATRSRLTALAVGTSSSMAKLNSYSLRRFAVCMPIISEQKAIVERLAPISATIRALGAVLEKWRYQKLGLMQALLTGKVRVPMAEPALA